MPAEADFDLWERARVDPEVDFGGDQPVRTVFGYGSLIFRPGFKYKRAYPACVEGFARRFWQKSCDHRGTPDAPGRVVVLVRACEAGFSDAGSSLVHGIVYEVESQEWPEVLEMLDIRERHGYTRTVAPLRAVTSEGVAGAELGKAIVYFADNPTKSAAYAGPEKISDTAAIIAKSSGPSGENDQYLFMLMEALRGHELPIESYLEELEAAVIGVQSSDAIVKETAITQTKRRRCEGG
eukprot:TRINITY_DN105582_c0_g1_i1.p1 TRINITY_DN105582_c0_g1~~TRINITY_DN105582_c0_g1_i1.p1  ORF type:complete len:238 (+),score=43.17 TRINITY_DN105582_c0_g1_i1:93-806(+)